MSTEASKGRLVCDAGRWTTKWRPVQKAESGLGGRATTAGNLDTRYGIAPNPGKEDSSLPTVSSVERKGTYREIARRTRMESM